MAPGYARVPNLHGLTRSRARLILHRAGLKASFRRRYSGARVGTVISQAPARGVRVREDSTVGLTLSAGPAPVRVPDVVGSSTSAAESALTHVKLRFATTSVPAPGVAAGQVTAQSPRPRTSIAPGTVVHLSVAEAPRWQGLTGFSGTARDGSVPFRIRGTRWRMVYDMGYRGTCSLIFICNGPSATVTNVSTGQTVKTFDLDEGHRRIWTFTTQPGVYRVAITPGSDDAAWSVRVQDWY
jgi:hypothetical protein